VLPANGSSIRDGIVESVGMPTSWLARFQIVEYLRAFIFARSGFNRVGGNMIISGAFGLFLREALIAAGGYEARSIGEDAELVCRIHRTMRERKRRYGVVHISDPVCFTEVPETLKVLGKQRDRWQRGLLDTLWRHRNMIFRPRYGVIGMLVMPMFLTFELMGPFVELAGWAWFAKTVVFANTDRLFVALFFLVAFLWGYLLSIQGVVLEGIDRPGGRPFRQQLLLSLFAAGENFGYRQINLYWRIRGVWKFVVGEKSWGDMQRRGLSRPGTVK
jgi:cellulose synthase/poly-beta-1,6-N-acetylglucosamine synthase-like glycosyltransferase